MEKSRGKMPISLRAKQFMPFQAVVGLDQALRKKEEEIEAYREVENVREEDVDE